RAAGNGEVEQLRRRVTCDADPEPATPDLAVRDGATRRVEEEDADLCVATQGRALDADAVPPTDHDPGPGVVLNEAVGELDRGLPRWWCFGGAGIGRSRGVGILRRADE